MARFKIGFLGAGNMAEALILGLIKKMVFRPAEIGATTAHPERLEVLRKRHGIEGVSSNLKLVEGSERLLLGVKPQQMRAVLEEVAPMVRRDHLILTIAAGLDTPFYYRFLPKETRLIRAMPNTPALLGEGAAGLFASGSTTEPDREFALKLFSSVGTALFVPREEWLDIVTALSGSGPAFVYLFIHSMIEAASRLGLPSDIARTLMLKTLAGAGKMVETSADPIADLIRRVASKGGTTEAGLAVLNEKGFARTIEETIEAATKRASELRRLA